METKLIEIRDRFTLIPAIAILLDGSHHLLRRAGYSTPCVLLTHASGGRCHYDPHQWGDRTYYTAHTTLQDHWDEYESGDVLDVEFVLGEADEPKVSEYD